MEVRCRHLVSGVLAAALALVIADRISAADDPVPFPDMAIKIGEILDDGYYDKARFHPVVMVERALRALTSTEMTIATKWTGGAIQLTIGANTMRIPAPQPATITQAMAILEAVRQKIDQANDFPPDHRRDLDYVMMNGAIRTLDPHSELYPPEPAREFSEEIKGEFFGIGAYLNQEEGIIAIEHVMPGLPADRAGVEDGDVILGIDNEKTAGLSLDQAVKRIKGPKGTTVTLTLERKGADKPLDLPITRDLVQVVNTRAWRDARGIGYVRMDEFSSNTHHELYAAIQKLQADGPLKAFVIDLRFNGGGLLDEAKLISNFFLIRSREIVRTVSSEGEPEITNSSGHPILDVPMVALVSGGTASAAEILSGALQCNDRAVVAGTTTFGKGSVQTIKGLEDGSKLRLTIQEYQLLGGVSIQDVGIIPDLHLVCHSVRENGGVDLIPLSREREVDDEFALHNTHPLNHSETYELGWVAPWQDKATLKRSSIAARDFQPDLEASLMIDLLGVAAADPAWDAGVANARRDGTLRQFLLERLKDPIAARAKVEDANLAAALLKATPPVAWGADTPVPANALAVTYGGPPSVSPGATTALTFTITNSSATDLGQLYGRVQADRLSPLWEEEMIVGQVAAHSATTASLTFAVPPRLYGGEERFTLELYQLGHDDPLAKLPVSITVADEPRPHFSYDWTMEPTPRGDGILQAGDSVTLDLTLHNDGNAPTTGARLAVFKSDDPYIKLDEVRFPFAAPIAPGASVVAKVPLTILREARKVTDNGAEMVPFSETAIKLEVRGEETFPDWVNGAYRPTLFSSITIPVGKPLPKRVTVVQPNLILKSIGMDPAGACVVKVAVTDDNLRYVALFADEDKVDLRAADLLENKTDIPADAATGMPEETSAIYTVSFFPKPGLNDLRVVAQDGDDVTEVLPLRWWAPDSVVAPTTSGSAIGTGTPPPAAQKGPELP